MLPPLSERIFEMDRMLNTLWRCTCRRREQESLRRRYTGWLVTYCIEEGSGNADPVSESVDIVTGTALGGVDGKEETGSSSVLRLSPILPLTLSQPIFRSKPLNSFHRPRSWHFFNHPLIHLPRHHQRLSVPPRPQWALCRTRKLRRLRQPSNRR